LGLGYIWPKNVVQRPSEANLPGPTFTSSTKYFMKLHDHKHLGTTNHSPYVAGFDYTTLAGAGVPAYSGSGPLLPENNMWTIIENYHADMNDMIPILFTRNVAAESLAAKVTESDGHKQLYFDTSWKTPFSNKGAVFIRKSGGMIKIRSKYMIWKVAYNRQTFDANADENIFHRTCLI
jgi:hypothetical protein